MQKQKQNIWVATVFTLSLITIICLFVVIALQLNTASTTKRQEKILDDISASQQEIKDGVKKIVLSGRILLDDDNDDEPVETSNDSTITVEELETFVEDDDIVVDDIVVEEKIVIHNDNKELAIGDNIVLPDVPTNTFRCEPYLVYNVKKEEWVSAFGSTTDPYKLQQKCLTDSKTGIRYYVDENGKKWYCAALAIAIIPAIIGSVWIATDMIVIPEHYEIMVSDDVNFNEFYQRYKIIEVRGRIYVVEERSVN